MARMLWGAVLATLLTVGSAWGAPYAWLAHYAEQHAARIDLATNETVHVTVGVNPISTAATPDGSRAYTSDIGGTISVIDGPSVTLLASVPMPATPLGVVVRADGGRAYAALGDGTVAVLDGSTGALLGTIPVAPWAYFGSFVSNAAGTRAYLVKTENAFTSVAVFDTVTDTFVADVLLTATNADPLGVAVSPDGTRVYATLWGVPAVFVIDATTNLLLGTIPLSAVYGAPQPVGLAVGADGTTVYVAEQGVDRVAVLDAAAMTEIGSLPVGSYPTSVDLHPDGSRAYVLNSGSASITMVDTATATVVGTVLTIDDHPGAGARFIVPGSVPTTTTTTTTTTSAPASTTTTASSTTTVSTSTTTTTTAVPPPPVLSSAALACQDALATSYKRFGAKVHGLLAACLGRVARDAAAGVGSGAAAARCVADLDPGAPTSRLVRLRTAARDQVVARCGHLAPADLGRPCRAGATSVAEIAACVLDAQLAGVVATAAAAVAEPCALATAGGIAAMHPALCAAP